MNSGLKPPFTTQERARRRAVYAAGNDFWFCSITGRVLCAYVNDNKGLCGCGQTTPAILNASPKADETGGIRGGMAHHVKKFLAPATVDDYVAQEERDAAENLTRRG